MVKKYEAAVYGNTVEIYKSENYPIAQGTLVCIPLDLFLTIANAILPLSHSGGEYPGTFRLSWSEPNE